MPGTELKMGIQLWHVGVCSQKMCDPPKEQLITTNAGVSDPARVLSVHCLVVTPRTVCKIGAVISILQTGSWGSLHPTCLCRMRIEGGRQWRGRGPC